MSEAKRKNEPYVLYYGDLKEGKICDIKYRDEQEAFDGFEQAGDVPKLLTLGDAVIQSAGDPNHLEHVHQRFLEIRDQQKKQPNLTEEMEVDQ